MAKIKDKYDPNPRPVWLTVLFEICFAALFFLTYCTDSLHG